MKKEIKKLNKSLKLVEKSAKKRAVLKVYLSIVLLGKKIPEVAGYFKLSENKVRYALTVCGIRLKKDKAFHAKLYLVAKAYMFTDELKLVA